MHPDRLLRALLAWTALTTVLFWLPAIRGAFDGPSYEWGLVLFSGAGTSGDYWFPALAAALALLTRVLGWRGARFPVHLLLAGWHVFLAVVVTLLAVRDPDGLRLQGDTLGLDVSLAVVGPAFFGFWAVLAVVWAARDLLRRGPRPALPWTASNTRRVLGLLALLPIQFVLLRFGAPGSPADQIGVVLTILQWFLAGAALRPRPLPAEAPPR